MYASDGVGLKRLLLTMSTRGAYTSVTRMREVVEANIVHMKILELPYLAPWVSAINKGIYVFLPVT